MIKFNQKRKKENIIYKTAYTPEKFKKVKEEGVSLRINGKTLKLKEKKELFKNILPNPLISIFNINEASMTVSFSIETDADRVFIDYKDLERFETRWRSIGIVDDYKSRDEKTLTFERSLGKSFKIRVTYYKGSSIQFEDYFYEDPAFKYFDNPPEILILKSNVINIKCLNLQRFAKEGYVRVFRKENLETEECIYSSKISSDVLSIEDNQVHNHDIYEYRADVFDNLGNVYKTTPKKINYKKSLSFKNKEIVYDKELNVYRCEVENATNIKVEKINTKKESVEIIKPSLKDGSVIFKVENQDNCIIHLEGYDSDGYLVVSAEKAIRKNRGFEIIDFSIYTNSQFQNVIKWNYTGNIDTFVVAARSQTRKRIVETLPHRVSPEGYLYCIDEKYSKERIYTEYTINAVNEFGTIINKKRLTKS